MFNDLLKIKNEFKNQFKIKKLSKIRTKNFKLKFRSISAHIERDLNEVKPPENVTKVEVVIKNLSEHSLSLSYLDFFVLNHSDEKLKFYPYADGIGVVLSKGESCTGAFYFVGEIDDFKNIEYQYM